MSDEEGELEERIEGGDELLYRVPVIDHPITVNEFHAHVIGLTGGAMITVAYLIGFETIAFLAAAGLVGYALFGGPFLRALPHTSDEYENTIALKTIKWEPWHFLGAFLVGVGAITLVTGTWPQ